MRPTDKDRLRVAEDLRSAAAYGGPHYAEELRDDLAQIIDPECMHRTHGELLEALADLIEPEPITGETSDGYHTFNELYDHRAKLFSVIVAAFPERAWKSRSHHDGTMYDGMFIVGIETPGGPATYHYDMDPYWDLFGCREVELAPEWDGHTPAQAIDRIAALAGIIGPEPTCPDWDGECMARRSARPVDREVLLALVDENERLAIEALEESSKSVSDAVALSKLNESVVRRGVALSIRRAIGEEA